jgi:hypothetical protein
MKVSWRAATRRNHPNARNAKHRFGGYGVSIRSLPMRSPNRVPCKDPQVRGVTGRLLLVPGRRDPHAPGGIGSGRAYAARSGDSHRAGARASEVSASVDRGSTQVGTNCPPWQGLLRDFACGGHDRHHQHSRVAAYQKCRYQPPSRDHGYLRRMFPEDFSARTMPQDLRGRSGSRGHRLRARNKFAEGVDNRLYTASSIAPGSISAPQCP